MKVLLKKVPVFWIVLSLTALLYLINFSVNDIWTENESFYAESVREMAEKGNYLEINNSRFYQLAAVALPWLDLQPDLQKIV
ncbi:hypothetical protein [Pelodictyon phaeoclathratiforme]|nr:hypothetical protein [Pelodictyon phaeoclathratiforme]MBV5289390.1 hypothetical protein [Pelodictyon phaeoclathratiforme]